MEGFDPSHSSKHQLTNVSEQSGFLEKDKKGHSDAFAQLLSEHQNVSDDGKGLLDPRVEMNQEIQAKVAERQELFLNVAGGRRTTQRRFVNRSCKAARLCGASAFYFAQVWCAGSKKRNDFLDTRVASVTFGRTGSVYVTDTWPRRLRR